MRILWIACPLTTVCLAAAWIGSCRVVRDSAGNPAALVLGYAHGEESISTLVVYPNGFLQALHQRQNLTTHDGLFYKKSRMVMERKFMLSHLFPQRQRGNKLTSRVLWHIGPPLALFGVLTVIFTLIPVLRRWHRRRNGLCLQCGYDMTGATTRVCTECSYENLHIEPSHGQ